MSGLSSTTWRTRSSGDLSVLSALGFDGSLSSCMKRAPGPVVRLNEHVAALDLIRSTTSR